MNDVIGLDLSLKTAQAAVLDHSGELVQETTVKATEAGLKRFFQGHEPSLVVVEAGGTTAWVARLAEAAGHEVIVANPRRVRLIAESSLKTDRIDAEVLARLARVDRKLLFPVQPRSEETQRGRGLLRVRSSLVRQRVESVNVVRGLLRGFGHRLAPGGAARFTKRLDKLELPRELTMMVAPLWETIDHLTGQIEKADHAIAGLARQHPVIDLLQGVPGVGPLIATSFVLCIEDPDRFPNARDVGSFLGLRPRLYKSGAIMRQGRISKEGDQEMRRLLTQGAHVLLNCKQDSDLQRWGRKLKEKIGTKKAVVAVARKLAVLLLVMWRDGAEFEPFLASRTAEKAA